MDADYSLKSKLKLNYKFRLVDSRDYKLEVPQTISKSSLANFSLQNKVKTVLDQGQLGSCVSNAFSQYINICTTNTVNISRLCHYYCGRSIEGDSSLDDSGLDIRQAASIITKYGACCESIWTYNILAFNQLPPLSVLKSSLYFKKYTYYFLAQNIITFKSTISNLKLPILFGINVYSSFMTASVAKSGKVPMPNVNTETLEGGHCIVMVGYNDNTQTFTCVNSWGSSWGQGGFFTIPYVYVMNPTLASDFCVLQFIY